MTEVSTLSPAQKAAATRRANKARALGCIETTAAPVQGFCESASLAAMGEADLFAYFQQIGREVSSRLRKQSVLGSWSAVTEYLRSQIGFEGVEHFRILFLDKRNQLIADETLSVGTVDHCPVYPREVAKRALEHGATGVILSHNHPSGDPEPSSADITMTKTLRDTLKPLGISVHDHIIVGRNGHVSMKGKQLF